MERPVLIKRRGRGAIFDLFVKTSQKIIQNKISRQLDELLPDDQR